MQDEVSDALTQAGFVRIDEAVERENKAQRPEGASGAVVMFYKSNRLVCKKVHHWTRCIASTFQHLGQNNNPLLSHPTHHCVTEGEGEFTVVCLHAKAGCTEANEQERQGMFKRLCNRLPDKMPLILAGDFNSTLRSSDADSVKILRSKRLRSAYESRMGDPNFISFAVKGFHEVLDHIWASEEVSVQSTSTCIHSHN